MLLIYVHFSSLPAPSSFPSLPLLVSFLPHSPLHLPFLRHKVLRFNPIRTKPRPVYCSYIVVDVAVYMAVTHTNTHTCIILCLLVYFIPSYSSRSLGPQQHLARGPGFRGSPTLLYMADV